MGAERVREYLLTHGVAYDLHQHDRAVSAQALAEAEHVSGRRVAKPVIMLADGKLVMGVLPGHLQLDLEKAARALDAESVRLATESEFAEAFGDCEPGAEPPLGTIYGMPTLIDLRLNGDTITFRGGTHDESITMSFDDYERIVSGEPVDIARE
jgi:Ala-tRNA(Pro) deacylase